MQIITAPVRQLDTSRSEERAPDSRRASTYTVSKTNSVWYKGILGYINIQRISKYTAGRSQTSRVVEKKAVTEESVVTIMPSFMRLGFDLRFVMGFGRIPRALNLYHVLPNDSEVFNMCRRGDIEGLQTKFSDGGLSSFILDEDGWSLLHVSISSRILGTN